jgi:hypothetical protein
MKSFITRFTSLVAFILLLSSCSLVNDVKFKNVSNIAPTFENKELVLKLDVQVQNDNFYAVKLKNSALKISIDEKELGGLNLVEKIVFKRKSDNTYPVKFHVKLADGAMFTLLRNAFKKEVTLTINGTLKGSALGIPKTITINEIKTIDGNLLKSLNN